MLLLLAGCKEPPSLVAPPAPGDPPIDDTQDETGGNDHTDCVAGIASTFPEPDATGVYYRTAIDVRFTQDETAASASLSLATAGGDDVAGTVTFDGRNARFAWSAPLSPNTEYVLAVDYSCDRTATVGFTTSFVGAPINATSIIGSVYHIDLGDPDIRIVDPPGVGDLLGGLLADQDVPAILVSPDVYDEVEDALTMIGTIGANGAIQQDTCTESIVFPDPADYGQNPYFEVAGESLEIAAAGVVISLERIGLSGAFAPDGSAIAGARLSGKVDTNALGDLVGDLGDVCQLVAGFGVQCKECSPGGPVTCLTLVADNITAARVSTDGLIEITAEDIAADEACEEN